MMVATTRSDNVTANEVAEEAARQLTGAFESSGEAFVRTPLLYPGGSGVAVNVAGSGDQFFVSDYGLGYHESELIGADRQYSRIAPRIAERAGLQFDRHAFFVIEVRRDQVPGACAAVANASKEAVDLAALRLAEKRDEDMADRLIQRLARVFKPQHVHAGVEVHGASSHAWHPTAVVEYHGHRTAFHHVKPNAQSVYAAVTMFHDLARLTEGPGRVAVTENRESLGTYINVLAQASNVLDIAASDKTFEKLAA